MVHLVMVSTDSTQDAVEQVTIEHYREFMMQHKVSPLNLNSFTAAPTATGHTSCLQWPHSCMTVYMTWLVSLAATAGDRASICQVHRPCCHADTGAYTYCTETGAPIGACLQRTLTRYEGSLAAKIMAYLPLLLVSRICSCTSSTAIAVPAGLPMPVVFILPRFRDA